MPAKIDILFVCLGNICRSPLAEGVFRDVVRERGWADRFEIDSAGTGSWHVGEPPDRRMQQTARSHGHDLSRQRARQFRPDDLGRYDHILAMDKDNLHDILYHDPDAAYGDKVRLFREFDPMPDNYQVPDPYYGGPQGFEQVYQIVLRTAHALLDHLAEVHHLEPSDA